MKRGNQQTFSAYFSVLDFVPTSSVRCKCFTGPSKVDLNSCRKLFEKKNPPLLHCCLTLKNNLAGCKTRTQKRMEIIVGCWELRELVGLLVFPQFFFTWFERVSEKSFLFFQQCRKTSTSAQWSPCESGKLLRNLFGDIFFISILLLASQQITSDSFSEI